MHKYFISMVLLFSISQAGELAKVNHSKLQFYVDKDTQTCENSQVLIENAWNKAFKTKSDAISFLIKSLEKEYKGKCKANEEKEERSLTINCPNKNEDNLNLIFFGDRDACTVWNEKEIAQREFEEENSNEISSIRNNLKNFQYIYFEEPKDCLPTIDVFNYQMSQTEEKKFLFLKICLNG